ncbi:hypothetical protein F4777DRAFT_582945 [Nemania sp. FL0916]|nr:hypothetical protein F4777DRAFT_582945 [Nemania sp. FL0916]
MQISTMFATAILALGIAAGKYKYCGCTIKGKPDSTLSYTCCINYSESHPHAEWVETKIACSDYQKSDAMISEDWEQLCKKTIVEGDPNTVHAHCFNN